MKIKQTDEHSKFEKQSKSQKEKKRLCGTLSKALARRI